MSDKKDQITLVTSDEETFNVDKKVAERSNLIKQMIEGELSICGQQNVLMARPRGPLGRGHPPPQR